MALDKLQPADIKPALTGFIREARYMLNPELFPDENTVHDVRVLMKKSRAILKLLRQNMGDEIFKREYSTLREVGRIMCSWRETSVLRKLLKNLKKRYPEVFSELSDNEKIKNILSPDGNQKSSDQYMKNDVPVIIDLLRKSEYRIRFISLHDDGSHSIRDSIEDSFGLVVRTYLSARNNPRSANMHELRKKTKDLLFQLQFFRPLNPKTVRSLEKKLDLLGQSLGKYNDLSVLINALGYKFKSSDPPGAIDRLAVIIRADQDKYIRKVWQVADRLFCPGKRLSHLAGLTESED
jgi:CHAD domain-containing protein